MRVTRLSLRNFRSYEAAEVALGPGITVVTGPNGAGKTNLLEAIYFACTGRSCRTANEREVVRFGAGVARLELDAERDGEAHRITVGFEPGEAKRLQVDGATVDRLTDAAARPLVSVFLPDRLELVLGAPALRRAHVDQVIFEAGGVVLSSRLIDGQFPNYRQLLPDAYDHELPLAGTEITEVVRRISLLAQKNAPLRLAFAEGELTVSARTPDVGEAQESLPVPYQGEPLEIGFNPEFLRDGLEAVESGDVLLKLISPLRPGLIEAADESGFQYLLMPIRLNV